MHSKNTPAKPSASVQHAADGLRRIVQMLRLSTHVIERRHGMTGAQLFVLQQLSRSPGLSLRELAMATRTDPSSVSVVVSRLSARGFVERKKASDDARRAVVRLSAKGAALLVSAPEPAQSQLMRALEGLPRPEVARFGVTLDRVARSMGASRGSAPMFFEEDSSAAPKRRGARARP
jgi:DNA-binding MarR family transcriptional regulator